MSPRVYPSSSMWDGRWDADTHCRKDFIASSDQGWIAQTDSYGWNLGHFAANMACCDAFTQWIQSGGDVAAITNRDETIGHVASGIRAFTTWCRALVKRPDRMDIIQHVNTEGDAIGHVHADDPGILTAWLNHGGDPSVINHQGVTIGMRAASHRSVDGVHIWMQHISHRPDAAALINISVDGETIPHRITHEGVLKRWHAMGGDVTAIDTHGRSIVDHVTSSAFLEAWLSCGGPATTLNDDQTRIVDRRFSEQIRSYRGPSYVRHATDDLIINMAFIQVKHHGSISIPRSRLLKACACPHGARLRQRLVMSCSDPLCMANWIACST